MILRSDEISFAKHYGRLVHLDDCLCGKLASMNQLRSQHLHSQLSVFFGARPPLFHQLLRLIKCSEGVIVLSQHAISFRQVLHYCELRLFEQPALILLKDCLSMLQSVLIVPCLQEEIGEIKVSILDERVIFFLNSLFNSFVVGGQVLVSRREVKLWVPVSFLAE